MQKTSNQKEIRIQHLLAISLSFFSLSFFCSSCYEPIEGCLDINSANYEVSADRACDSCCTFPNFNLNINQVFLGEDFSLGDTLTNNLGEEFSVTNYDIIFSEFSLSSNGLNLTVTDSTMVNCNGSPENYETDDLIRLNSTSGFATVGAWRYADPIDKINFVLGLNDCIHNNVLDDLDEDSRLVDLDSLYQSGLGYRTFLLEINDSLTYQFIGSGEALNISQPIAGSNARGFDLVLDMNIDFGIWLSDFSVNDDIQTTKTKLIQKVNQAVTIAE